MNVKLIKTDLGRTEMRTRELGLPVLERRLLILADGTRSLTQLQQMVSMPVVELAAKLVALGLLENASQTALTASHADQAAMAARAVARTQPAPLAYDAYDANDAGVDLDADGGAALADDLASDFAEERVSTWSDSAGLSGLESEFPDETIPGMLTHRSASVAGLAAGKSYLIATSQTMLGANSIMLDRKILNANTEADLYYVLEMLVTAISPKASSSDVNGIIQRFERKISQR